MSTRFTSNNWTDMRLMNTNNPITDTLYIVVIHISLLFIKCI